MNTATNTQQSVTEIVGDLIRACLATGEVVTAVRDKDGTPRWVSVKRSGDLWKWESGTRKGFEMCPFDAVWKAVTDDQVAIAGIRGVQLGVAFNALCA